MTLILDPNWQDADAFYEALIAAHGPDGRASPKATPSTPASS